MTEISMTRAIQLGDRVRDKITEFEGVATGKASYITGCDQYLVQPPAKDGDFKDGRWIDEGRLDVIDTGIAAAEVKSEKKGSDIPAPVK